MRLVCPRNHAQALTKKHRIRPTFRPDDVTNLLHPTWQENVRTLASLARVPVADFASFLRALAERRRQFIELGATSSDHGRAHTALAPSASHPLLPAYHRLLSRFMLQRLSLCLSPPARSCAPAPRSAERPLTLSLPREEAEAVFARALAGGATADDARRFSAHMLLESARMSAADGLVMQLHAGVRRNHDPALLAKYGADKGADIPLSADWTDGLAPLLVELGNHPNLTLVLFTLDEATYSRELAPLAGYYRAVRLGPPWWFHDSRLGMRRYLDGVVETAGVQNLAGFNDDTRAFLSIPARHTVWRRVVADWVAELHARGAVDWKDALAMAHDLARERGREALTCCPTRAACQPLFIRPADARPCTAPPLQAYGLAKKTYKL